MQNNTIVFDRQELTSLKRAYTNAINQKKEIFVFRGHDLFIEYAKYLIQYLESKFN